MTPNNHLAEPVAERAEMEALMNPTPAALAVDLIIDDLSDRSGLDGAWGSIDADIQVEIKTAWIAAVQSAYARAK